MGDRAVEWGAPWRAALVPVLLLACLAATARGADDTSDSVDRAINAPSMFAKGTWTTQFHGAYFHSVVDDEDIYNAVASAGYYFDHKHVFRVELLGYRLDQEGTGDDADDATGMGVNLGLRYHFLERERLSLFFEGIAGLFYGHRNFPEGGTHFNFNEQLGLGATLRMRDNLHLIGGVRFIHISNARIRGEDENPSFNGLGGFVGVMFTY